MSTEQPTSELKHEVGVTPPANSEAVQAALAWAETRDDDTALMPFSEKVGEYMEDGDDIALRVLSAETRRLQSALAEKEKQVVQAVREAAHQQMTMGSQLAAAADKRIGELESELHGEREHVKGYVAKLDFPNWEKYFKEGSPPAGWRCLVYNAISTTLQKLTKAEQERDRYKTALENLTRKLEVVHASDNFMAVWSLYTCHGNTYPGPFYVDEFKAAQAALAMPGDAAEEKEKGPARNIPDVASYFSAGNEAAGLAALNRHAEISKLQFEQYSAKPQPQAGDAPRETNDYPVKKRLAKEDIKHSDAEVRVSQ